MQKWDHFWTTFYNYGDGVSELDEDVDEEGFLEQMDPIDAKYQCDLQMNIYNHKRVTCLHKLMKYDKTLIDNTFQPHPCHFCCNYCLQQKASLMLKAFNCTAEPRLVWNLGQLITKNSCLDTILKMWFLKVWLGHCYAPSNKLSQGLTPALEGYWSSSSIKLRVHWLIGISSSRLSLWKQSWGQQVTTHFVQPCIVKMGTSGVTTWQIITFIYILPASYILKPLLVILGIMHSPQMEIYFNKWSRYNMRRRKLKQNWGKDDDNHVSWI